MSPSPDFSCMKRWCRQPWTMQTSLPRVTCILSLGLSYMHSLLESKAGSTAVKGLHPTLHWRTFRQLVALHLKSTRQADCAMPQVAWRQWQGTVLSNFPACCRWAGVCAPLYWRVSIFRVYILSRPELRVADRTSLIYQLDIQIANLLEARAGPESGF